MAHRQSDEDRDAKLEYFHHAVSNPEVKRRLSLHLSSMEGGDEVAPSDVQAAGNYLRTCILNMDMPELEMKSLDELAALWARGALGAAQYRRQRQSTPSHGERARRRRRSAD
jgi:hypothetical protein